MQSYKKRNPWLQPSVNNLLMTEDLMLTSTQRLPSSVTPLHLEGGEGELGMHGPMLAQEELHSRRELLQKEGAILKRHQNQEKNVGKNLEEGELHDDEEPPSQGHQRKRTYEQRTKKMRKHSSGGSSSSS